MHYLIRLSLKSTFTTKQLLTSEMCKYYNTEYANTWYLLWFKWVFLSGARDKKVCSKCVTVKVVECSRDTTFEWFLHHLYFTLKELEKFPFLDTFSFLAHKLNTFASTSVPPWSSASSEAHSSGATLAWTRILKPSAKIILTLYKKTVLNIHCSNGNYYIIL